jgi:Icc-related predicted phosphoesterase
VRIEPEDTVRLYDKNVDFIAKMLELSDEPFNVVLTHHAPSYKSVSPHFIGNAANGAFVSNLEDFILDRPKIRVWAHGHTHSPCDYRIGECRVVGNPLGYGRELYKNDHEYKPITIEVLK